VVFLSHQVGSFFGAWMGGVVFDRTGKYDFAWGALIVIGVAAFALQWLMDESPPSSTEVGAVDFGVGPELLRRPR
jgi:predicted MFS family arabinose efflux permease